MLNHFRRHKPPLIVLPTGGVCVCVLVLARWVLVAQTMQIIGAGLEADKAQESHGKSGVSANFQVNFRC